MEQALYLRIAASLRASIISGQYKANDSLPSENELAASYETTRATVRKSLNVLESEGLIKPWQGKGYFVQPPRHTLFTLEFGESEHDGHFRYQEVNIVRPELEIVRALHLELTQPAIVMRKILELDDRLIAYDEKYIPYERGVPSVEFELHFSEFPDMFADRFAPMSLRTEMTIGAEAPPEHVVRALRWEEGLPLLVITRLIVSSDGQPIGYGKQYLTPEYGKLKAKSGYYTPV